MTGQDATLLEDSRPVEVQPRRAGGLVNRWIDARLGPLESDRSIDDAGAWPGWKPCLAVLGFYAVAIAIATYPMIVTIRTAIPWNVDPVTHLTIMRWYKTCLLEGRSPFLYPEIQHPFGAPVGSFPPMVLQTLAYLALSTAIDNDTLCYNTLWLAGFLLAGMGTFLLAYRVVGNLACAVFAGVAAMLGGPMMMHAQGHLELMYVGWFPLFLIAWMRFVDRPGGRSMAIAAASYSLMTMSTGYFAVMAVVPATWYLLLGMIGAARRGNWAWFRPRAIRLVGFAALVGPILLLTFSGQLWNVAHGLVMNRSKVEFSINCVPWYGYVVPTVFHPLNRPVGVEGLDALGGSSIEGDSYLGVVTLGLVLYAAVQRVKFRQSAFWWSITSILVVLSFGPTLRIWRFQADLPGSWLYDHFFAFRFLRAPGRFNLFAAVTAAVLAAAGLKDLIARWSRPAGRWWAICGALTAVAVVDLSMVPFGSQEITPVPTIYGRLLKADPAATFLDAPMFPSGTAHPSSAASGYWQSFHRGRTTGGYSAHSNIPFDNQLVHNTPFSSQVMTDRGYLTDLDSARFGIVSGVGVLDYIWLYLTANDLRYVVLHHSKALVPDSSKVRERLQSLQGRERLQSLLEPVRIFADEAVTVFDRNLLPPPIHPVLACAEGWRGGWHGRKLLIASKLAAVRAYSPDPTHELIFTLKARAFREPRMVRLRSKGVELAAWTVRPDIDQTLRSPSFRLPAGLQSLTIESDGEEQPRQRHEFAIDGDDRPYTLSVSEVSLRECPVGGPQGPVAGTGGARTSPLKPILVVGFESDPGSTTLGGCLPRSRR